MQYLFENTQLPNRTLIRGDNLDEMRKIPDNVVALIATDPPFNSKRNYFVPYRDEHGKAPDTLVKAFTDTWKWGDAAEAACEELICEVGGAIGETIEGLQNFLKQTPMMAYLAMMGIRLVEMHRILKPTGSIYLHCDAAANHYLKILMDAVFGPNNFKNEIVWCYDSSGRSRNTFSKKHDVIYFYAKSAVCNFNGYRVPHSAEELERDYRYYDESGRRYRTSRAGGKVYRYYADEGKMANDWWVLPTLNSTDSERAGYPTQKPIALYKRIIEASSNEGDLVLDPFCGCGTTLLAAEELNRRWLGIDLTYLATGAVKLQVEKFFPQLKDSITLIGTPENVETALQLAREDHRAFEEWCITHVLKFTSNAKKVADGGIDGMYRFPIGKVQGRGTYGKMVAQVKGGSHSLGHIRDFRTAMQNVNADLGIFVVTKKPSDGMLTEARRAKRWKHPLWEMEYPRVQIYPIQDYFDGIKPKVPVGERRVL